MTLWFWIVKVLSTTVGETGADYLAVHAGLGQWVTGALTTSLLIGALMLQLRSVRYAPWKYWFAVVLLSVVGTQITDALTDGLGVSLYATTALFAVALAGVFRIWYVKERTLSIRTIFTPRRELFYWAAILSTFALGTAAGDLVTEALGLGFQLGVVLFGAAIAVTALVHQLGRAPLLTFWIAYVFTRPLGASLGDLLSQARAYGGLGLGTALTSAVFVLVIITIIIFMTRAQAPVRSGD